jgi:hypothetical protein
MFETGMSIAPPSGRVLLHEAVTPHVAVTAPAQEPCALHASPVVHAMPSSHGVPALAGAWTHPVADAQPSVVHGLPSLQLMALPPEQVPDAHV